MDRGEVVVGDLSGRSGRRTDRPSTPGAALGIGAARPGIGARLRAAARRVLPNGDGSRACLRLRWTNAVATSTRSRCAFPPRREAGSRGPSRRVDWAGAQSWDWNGARGRPTVRNGRYVLQLVGGPADGRSAPPRGARTLAQLGAFGVTVDTRRRRRRPRRRARWSPPTATAPTDSTALKWSSTEPLTGGVKILKGSTVVRSWTMTAKSSGAITWTGKNDAGASVADGAYTFRVHGRDRAGNPVVRDVDVQVDRTLRAVGRTPSRFYPQDGDGLKPSTRMSYTLTRSARATLEILRGSTVVRTVYHDRSLAAGTYGWMWNGRDAAGEYVSRGTYTLRLSATSTVGTTVVNQKVLADAFRTVLSASTRSPGQEADCHRRARRTVARRAAHLAHPGRQIGPDEDRDAPVVRGVPGDVHDRLRGPGHRPDLDLGTDTSGGINRSFATVAVQ